tara:strand:+ start:184 stop:654 length:471 start_codon:yes stop_codon:yes gene_type:complete
MNSELDLITVAKRHNVPITTMRSQAQRERWHDQRTKLQTSAREAATVAVMREIEQRDGLLKKVEARSVEQVIERSRETGDRLYTLFRGAVHAMQQGDLKTMRVAVDTWVALDNQMRKVHRIETEEDKPLVSINVMAALPKHVTEVEAEAVEVEVEV